MNILNKITLLSTLLLLIGCSSYDKSVFQNTESIKDKTLSSDFKDEGIKITYSITGNLKSIEVYGQADAWKDNVQILAEAERSLLEVLNGACDTPVGANAVINDEGELFLQAELLSLDGKKSFRAHSKTGGHACLR